MSSTDGTPIPPTLPLKPTRTGFFSLSAELRNKIYSYLTIPMHEMHYAGNITRQIDYLCILSSDKKTWKPVMEPGLRTTPSLSDLSVLSKQFASEFRPVYFASWEKILISQGKATHFMSSSWEKPQKFTRNTNIGSGDRLKTFMKLVGREAKFVRKWEVLDQTAMALPGPSEEMVKERLGLEGYLEEGQRVEVRFTVDPFGCGDVREFGEMKFVFEGEGMGGVRVLEVKRYYC